MAPLDKSHPSLHLLIPPTLIYLAQYPASHSIPPSVFTPNSTSDSDTDEAEEFLSVTRSKGETTVLYSIPLPAGAGDELDGGAVEGRRKERLARLGLGEPGEADGHYAAIKVQGPLDLSLTGILSELALALKQAGVPIFAISTWNTDYILVRHSLLQKAKEGLQAEGWHFV